MNNNKHNVIDLFSGSGGFGLGFIMAGYDLFLSIDVDKWATDTLIVNNKNGMDIYCENIRSIKTNEEILSLCNKEPDIIIGGPPCQGFSNAGNGSIDPNDPRNSLFKYFAKWVRVLKPKIFVIENVRGILTKKNLEGKKVIDIIEATFSKIGYGINIWVLNSAEYGVPQTRKRVFIVGNNSDIEIPVPPATHYVNIENKKKGLKKALTVKDAINDLPRIKASEGEEKQKYSKMRRTKYQEWAKGDQKILYNHVAMKHTKRIVERFKHIEVDKPKRSLPADKYEVRRRNGNGELSSIFYNMNNRRLNKQKPAPTIPASFYSSFVHPNLHRNITAREAARLQSFPDYYRFEGKRTIISNKLLKKLGMKDMINLSQYNQIGNAVPPLLAKAIAKHLQFYLKTSD